MTGRLLRNWVVLAALLDSYDWSTLRSSRDDVDKSHVGGGGITSANCTREFGSIHLCSRPATQTSDLSLFMLEYFLVTSGDVPCALLFAR
jgi:hypothetical protein